MMLFLSVFRIAQVFLECGQRLMNECFPISGYQSYITSLNAFAEFLNGSCLASFFYLQAETQPAKIRLTCMATVRLFIAVVRIIISSTPP